MPPTSPADAVTLALPVRNAGERLVPVLKGWAAFLQEQLGRGYELIVVDDGSADATAALVEQFAASTPHVRLLRHDNPLGFGASLRTALAAATHPVFAYTAADYPYTPADLTRLLTRLGEVAPVFDVPRIVEAVSGCRTGRPVPAGWGLVGRTYRMFARVALGLSPPPLAGWLGLREHFRSWWLWLTMGVPLVDVSSGMKAFRRSLFDRFPIQSDGDFVHAEIFAKLTFLTVLVAEEPLSPVTAVVPRSWWADFWRVFKDARFHSPLPDLSKPAG